MFVVAYDDDHIDCSVTVVVRSKLHIKKENKLQNLRHSDSNFLPNEKIKYSQNMALDFFHKI